ncbi:MAG: hypothetical protein J7M14_04630, partial [Planctomycetes bacterium]|nr:hypothetical protein [Planctomycetota bacterium]
YKELARYHEDAGVRNRKTQALGIDVVRKFLIAPSLQAPIRGRVKVFVVIEAELMSREAQNALLKTLEEPPDDVIIVLICRNLELMLPTIVSRCAIVRFGLLPLDFVAGKLAEEGIGAAEAGFWAAYTRGSVGRAGALAGQGLYETKQEVIARLAAMGSAGDSSLGEHLAGIMDKLAGAVVAETKEMYGADLARSVASRRAAATLLELITSAYTDAMALAAGAETPLVHEDRRDDIAAIARKFSLRELAAIIEQLSVYESLLWRNVSAKTVWDNVVITCASAAPLKL